MLNLNRVADLLFPSVPRHLAAEIAAHGCAQTPGPSSQGEGSGGPGQTPAAEAPTATNPSDSGSAHLAVAGPHVVTQPVTGDDHESGAGTASLAPLSPDRPENEQTAAGDGSSQGDGTAVVGASHLTSFSGPPSCERLQSEPIHPSARWRFEDRSLALLLDQWGATS